MIASVMLMAAFRIDAQIYVSPQGNDSNPGTIDKPLQTITKAMSLAQADSTIYLRGGVYELSTTVKTPRDGQEGKYIKLWAYPGETPVLDFSGQPYSTKSRGLYLSKLYWYVKGLTVRYAGDNGVFISGGNNIVENCIIYGNKDTGLQISDGGHDNIIKNCDSFHNYDPATHGENADGFAPKLSVGPGNKFIGCRAWENADDGWDFYEAKYEVVLDSCWSFHNGYNLWNDTGYQGDGNGFKVGGNYVPTPHKIMNCVALFNKAKGFDQNHNTGDVTVYNCTGWKNGTNFSFYETPQSGENVLKNNISYQSSVNLGASVQETNSWQGFTVSSSDFVSLDTAQVTAPRNSDGSLPSTGLLKLASGSPMIDAGTDVGLAYNGSAPDLGAFESSGVSAVTAASVLPEKFELDQNYPNPFNPSTTIRYNLKSGVKVSIQIFDPLGRIVTSLVNKFQNRGTHQVQFNSAGLSSGIYYYRLNAGGNIFVRKMILLR